MAENTEVVVIGGGYAGVMAANRLTQRAGVTVTLINPRAEFVERIRLHQLVGGSHSAVHAYREVLAKRVDLLVGTVTRIDAATRTLTLAGGGTTSYDYLVYAAGSRNAVPTVPGAAEHAHPLSTLEQARLLRPAVEAATALTVVGAGPSGIETAAELAEQGRTVTLVCGGVLGPYLHPRVRREVNDRLTGLGVTVVDGPGSVVTRVTADAVHLADGREIPSPLTVWTAGFGVPDLAARSGLTTDETGRLLTTETLTSVDDPHIVAAGDSAAPSGLPYRMSCQAAGPLGAQAAETVLARIAGTSPAPAAIGYFGQCLSLGRGKGVFQFAHRDDTATKYRVQGTMGAKLKEFICRGTVWQLTIEARRPGAVNWAVTKDPTRAARLQDRVLSNERPTP
jgi:NADH dehydrogenase FAD-containing subunit